MNEAWKDECAARLQPLVDQSKPIPYQIFLGTKKIFFLKSWLFCIFSHFVRSRRNFRLLKTLLRSNFEARKMKILFWAFPNFQVLRAFTFLSVLKSITRKMFSAKPNIPTSARYTQHAVNTCTKTRWRITVYK